MEELVVQTENVFVNWDLMDQLVKHVTYNFHLNKFNN